jgi:putative heme-binding domain-containing protein
MSRVTCLIGVVAVLGCAAATAQTPAEGDTDADGVSVLVEMLAENNDPQFQLDILKGINAAMEGRRRVVAPKGWTAVRDKLFASASRDVRAQAQSLAVVFGDTVAFDLMRKTLADRSADVVERRHALQSLLAANDAKLPKVLLALLDDAALREPALLALAGYDEPETPRRVLAGYDAFSVAERRAALSTLGGRTEYAKQLVAAVRAGKVPVKDLTASTARQLRELGDKEVDAFVDEVWGVARTSPKEKTDLMAKYKSLLTDDRVALADVSNGRAVFARNCAQCHTLYGEGGAVGPDLTGSNRFNLDYVLQNVIDPSAVIAKEFQVTLLRTKDGRVLSGIAQEGDHAVTIVSETGKVVVPHEEVDKIKRSDLSMMPDGLINGLSEKDFTDLVAYLRTTHHVKLPGGSNTSTNR